MVQTISTAQIEVYGGKVSFTAVSASGIAVVEFGSQAVVTGDRGTHGKLVINRLHIVQVRHPGGRGDIFRIQAGTRR
ncbi:hypothetical protein D3C79_1002380 [compost metagenome]